MVGELAAASQEKMPQLMEPDKCEGWMWTRWDAMKEWALAEMDGAENEIEGLEEPQCSNSGCSTNIQTKLFLPLLNLVRDRPGVIPRPVPGP